MTFARQMAGMIKEVGLGDVEYSGSVREKTHYCCCTYQKVGNMSHVSLVQVIVTEERGNCPNTSNERTDCDKRDQKGFHLSFEG